MTGTATSAVKNFTVSVTATAGSQQMALSQPVIVSTPTLQTVGFSNSTCNEQAAVGGAFTCSIALSIKDSNNNPVPGVTFSVTGASITPPVTGQSITSASVSGSTLNIAGVNNTGSTMPFFVNVQATLTFQAVISSSPNQSVTRPPQVVTTLTLSPPTQTLTVGATGQENVSAFDQYGASISSPSGLIWNSSNIAVATVNATGLVTAVAAGTANVSVSGGNASPQTSVITVQAVSLMAWEFTTPVLTFGNFSDSATFGGGNGGVVVFPYSTSLLIEANFNNFGSGLTTNPDWLNTSSFVQTDVLNQASSGGLWTEVPIATTVQNQGIAISGWPTGLANNSYSGSVAGNAFNYVFNPANQTEANCGSCGGFTINATLNESGNPWVMNGTGAFSLSAGVAHTWFEEYSASFTVTGTQVPVAAGSWTLSSGGTQGCPSSVTFNNTPDSTLRWTGNQVSINSGSVNYVQQVGSIINVVMSSGQSFDGLIKVGGGGAQNRQMLMRAGNSSTNGTPNANAFGSCGTLIQ